MSTTPIADTILTQLGGRRFTLMTGAYGYLGGSTELQFALPRNASRINKVRIVLEPTDLYTVQCYKIAQRGLRADLLASFEGVYADQLRTVFTKATGLDTSL